MYLLLAIRVFNQKYFISIVINFALGVETMILRRIFTVVKSTVGVPQSPGYFTLSPPTVSHLF